MGEYRGDFGLSGWVGHVELEEINMGIKSQLVQVSRNWRLILAVNIFLGVSLLFGMFTDFEFRNRYVNLLFPFIVLAIGLVTINKLHVPTKRLRNLLCLPSIVLGLPYMFLAFITLINPFSWLLMNEIVGTKLVDTYNSPDKNKSAEVYIMRSANYEMETYNVEVKLRYRFLPFIVRDICERDICKVQSQILLNAKDVNDYKFSWIDNNHLSISYKNNSNQDKVVNANEVKFNIPFPLKMLMTIFQIG